MKKITLVILLAVLSILLVNRFMIFELHEEKTNAHVFINLDTNELVEIPLVQTRDGVNYVNNPSPIDFACTLLRMHRDEQWNIAYYKKLTK